MSVPSTPSTSRPVSPEASSSKPYRFQYAESVVSRGPESVTGDTTVDYFMGSRLDLGELTNEWTSVRDGFNAISTVLNSPHKKQAPPKAHSALPAVASVQLPRVRRKDFDGYLNTISPEYDKFLTNLHGSQEDHQPLQPHLPQLDVVPDMFFHSDFDLTRPDTFSQVTSLLSGEEVDPTSIGHSLPLVDALSAYADTVEAHLSNEISARSSSFFAALSNLNQLQSSSTQTLDRIRQLREKLKEVDQGQAKVGLQAVTQEVKLGRIHSVLHGVTGMQTAVHRIGVMRGLVDDGKWEEALVLLDQVEKMWNHSTIALRLPTKRGKQPSVVSSPAIPVPLADLSAFSLLPTHLKALTQQIVQSLSDQTASWLQLDLEKQIYEEATGGSLRDSLTPVCRALLRTRGVKDAVLRWRQVVLSEVVRGVFERHIPNLNLESSDTGSTSSDEERENFKRLSHSAFLPLLRDLYKVLIRALESLSAQNKALLALLEDEAVKSYGIPPLSSILSAKSPSNIVSPIPRSATTLQPPISPLLPPSSPRLTTPSSPRLGSPIIPLPQSPGLSPMSHTPVQASSMASPSSSILPNIQEELSDLLATSAELTNTLSSKLLLLHPSTSSSSSQLPLPSFVRTFTTSWSFILSCEILSGKMIVGLRGVLVGMAKQYLSTMHQHNLTVMAKAVEDELWNPVPNVSSEIQQDVVEVLLECAMKDAQNLKIPSNETVEEQSKQNPDDSSSANKPVNGTAVRKHLQIETSSFFLVPCTQILLSTLLKSYVALIINIPILTIDTMSRVIEFLKMFNGRVCQVVLGAGAMRSAGLKNITAKHLALASQTLSILITLIPYVREMFRRHLSPKQAVMLVEFDKLKRDYQEHQNEIHSKLVAIMGDRLSAHLKSFQAVDWKAPPPTNGVNNYMVVLVKETTTLHKVLSRYLNVVVVEFVMSQVFAAINHRLSEEYSKTELPSEEAKQRLLGDARHLHAKLSELKGVGHVPTAMLEVVIQEKRIPRAPRPQPPPQTDPTPSISPEKAPAPPVQSPPPQTTPVVKPPQRSSTLQFGNTNARLKGLLSGHGLGRNNTLSEKALPTPQPEKPEPLDQGSGPASGFRQIEGGLNSPLPPDLRENGNPAGATEKQSSTPSSPMGSGQLVLPDVGENGDVPPAKRKDNNDDDKVDPPISPPHSVSSPALPPPGPESPSSSLPSVDVVARNSGSPKQPDTTINGTEVTSTVDSSSSPEHVAEVDSPTSQAHTNHHP